VLSPKSIHILYSPFGTATLKLASLLIIKSHPSGSGFFLSIPCNFSFPITYPYPFSSVNFVSGVIPLNPSIITCPSGPKSNLGTGQKATIVQNQDMNTQQAMLPFFQVRFTGIIKKVITFQGIW